MLELLPLPIDEAVALLLAGLSPGEPTPTLLACPLLLLPKRRSNLLSRS
jgi:hypothetical protein